MKKILSYIDTMTVVFTVFAIIVQLVIIGIIPFVFEGNVPVSEDNTVTVSFKPDKVEVVERRVPFARYAHKEKIVYFYHNSEKYRYLFQFFSQYDGDDLVNDLKNEYLTVTCKNGTNDVVALKGENIVFHTLESYNSSATIGLIFGILFMVLIESIYLFASGYYVFSNYVPPYSYSGFAFKKIGIHIHNHQCRKYNIK